MPISTLIMIISTSPNIIYEDDGPRSEVRLVLDGDNHVVDMYMGDPDAGSWTKEAVESYN